MGVSRKKKRKTNKYPKRNHIAGSGILRRFFLEKGGTVFGRLFPELIVHPLNFLNVDPSQRFGRSGRFGLISEQITGMKHREQGDFSDHMGLFSPRVAYLNPRLIR